MQLIVIAETEFWPNFLRLAKRSGALLVVVNARLSYQSLGGYKRLHWWLPSVMANVDLFLAQTWEDRKRLLEIGASESRIETRLPGPCEVLVRELESGQLAARGIA